MAQASNTELNKQLEVSSKPGIWTWLGIGIGTGLVVTVVAGLGYHYFESQRRHRDPRAERVKDLIEEAERLLAQGRKAQKPKEAEI
jgi:hypothetical protein